MAGRKRPPASEQPDLFAEAGLSPAPPAEAPPKRPPPPDLSATDDASLSALAFVEAPVALLVLANRRILQANPAAAALFGWPRHLMQGQSVRMLYPSAFEFRAVGERWLRLMRDRPVHEDERVMQARGGTMFWARARGRTLTPDAPFELMVWTFEKLEGPETPDQPGLTAREREIALHVVAGRTAKQIARLLDISHRTVEVHRASVMRKLGARNVAELVSRIMETR
ncbi:LuxR family transcriptional regulator [Albimonas pacifica]|uniref:PAS domain S-box-containing protein n=1 Tax=Albimonas pacifica TaxID=1114924 RepID=A0A1I3BRR1_9RHOB|nr:LuxR C-terminal-related transcriptional regulator [Albimonas pacifica]SFH64985.1 PAS domain S-box-containing protein [Albimonas pacifica]